MAEDNQDALNCSQDSSRMLPGIPETPQKKPKHAEEILILKKNANWHGSHANVMMMMMMLMMIIKVYEKTFFKLIFGRF